MNDPGTTGRGARADRLEALFCRYRDHKDADALGAVFDATSPSLLRVALHCTRSLDEAEDLVQETFLTAIRKARSYRSEGRLRAWLTTILENRARGLHRWRRRRRMAPPGSGGPGGPGDPAEPVDPAATADPGRTVATRELHGMVERGVRAVPEPYRTVLGLRYLHGFDAREIAETLARPLETVRSQIKRGTEHLRRELPAAGAGVALAALEELPSAPRIAAIRAAVVREAGALSTSSGLATLTLTAAAVLVLVAGAWAVLRPSVGSAPRTPDALSEPLATTGSAGTSAEAPDRAGPVARRAASPDDPGARVDDGLVEIVVRDRARGTPCPHAEVFAGEAGRDFESTEEWSEHARAVRGGSFEAWTRFCQRYVADAEGRCRIPLSYTVFARWKDRLGVSTGGGPVGEVLVEQEHDTRVRVVDDDGRPVRGIQVHVRSASRPWPTGFIESRVTTTGDDGVGVLRNMRALVRQLRSEQDDGRSSGLVVAAVWIGTCATDSVEIGLSEPDPTAPLTDEITLRVPVLGRIEARLVTPDGVPWAASAAHAEHEEVALRLEAGQREGYSWSRAPDVDGRVVFDHVPLGVGEARLRTFRGERVAVALPNRAEPVRRVRITVPHRRGTVVTALDDAGAPIAGCDLYLFLQADGAFHDNVTNLRVRTDGDGRFVVPAVGEVDGVVGATFDLVVEAVEVGWDETRRTGRSGSIRLDRARLEQGGLVVTARDGSLRDEGRQVVLRRPDPLASGRFEGPREALRSIADRVRIERRQAGRWVALAHRDAGVVVERDGRFRVVSASGAVRAGAPLRLVGEDPEPEALDFVSYAPWFLPIAPVEFVAGTDDELTVVAADPASVWVDVAPDAGEDAVPLLTLEPGPGAPAWARAWRHPLLDTTRFDDFDPPSTAFRARRIPPGTYAMQVHFPGSDDPVFEAPAVELGPGRRFAPFRQRPLDGPQRNAPSDGVAILMFGFGENAVHDRSDLRVHLRAGGRRARALDAAAPAMAVLRPDADPVHLLVRAGTWQLLEVPRASAQAPRPRIQARPTSPVLLGVVLAGEWPVVTSVRAEFLGSSALGTGDRLAAWRDDVSEFARDAEVGLQTESRADVWAGALRIRGRWRVEAYGRGPDPIASRTVVVEAGRNEVRVRLRAGD